MSVADANHVRVTGHLPGDASNGISDAVIAPHLRTAGRRLLRWVGASAYAASETEAAGLGSPRNYNNAASEQTKALADAEAYLALALGITSFNIVMTNSGGNAAGLQAEGVIGDSTFRYRNQSDVEKMQESFIRQAEAAAQDYIQDDGGGGSPIGISYALDDEGAEIDADWPE